MTWDINTSPSEAGTGVRLTPTQVLYRYDTPLLFQTKMGVIDALCYKLEELGPHELFLICPTDDKTIDALKRGLLSVRGALDAPSYWIVEAKGYEAKRAWSVRKEDLPNDFLPEPKGGLFAHFGEVPDTIEDLDAFLSIKFSGPELSASGFSFKTFKALVDEVYTAVHRLFTPSALTGVRVGQLFDFEITQPRFASLSITVRQPVVDVQGLRRRRKIENDNLEREIISEIITDRDDFLSKTTDIVEHASRGTGIAGIVSENLTLVDVISNLIPFEGAGYDTVEFNANTANGRRRVIIDETAAARIREAHAAAETKRVTITGVIIEINSIKRTFVIKAGSERQTTCAFAYELYDRLHNAGAIKIGARVIVRGNFWRRVRRDYISVDREPEFKER